MKKILLISILLLSALLRLYHVGSFPALNADEAALGYNSYSLIQTGKDEHGNSWPIHFQSFNDYKPGLYVYLVIPFVKMFGLEVWAVRMPGVIAGVLTVYLIYLLSKVIAKRAGLKSDVFPLVTSLLLAVSPWHIHFSRGAWEVNVSTMFIVAGVYFFLRWAESKKFSKYLMASILLFAMSLYTYHAARLIVPLLGLGLVGLDGRNIKRHYRKYFLPVLAGAVVLVPLLLDLAGPAGLSRAAGVGLFADPGPVNRANEQRGEHEDYQSSFAKILHNKPVNYVLVFLQNWSEHYHGEFLFLSGEEIQRNKVPETGELYLFELITVIVGLIFIVRKSKGWGIILWWVAIAPIPAALTFQSPHALRAQNLVVPLTLISGYGLTIIIDKIGKLGKYKSVLFLVLTFIVAISIVRYLHMYYVHMAKEYSFSSQYGMQELVSFMKEKDKEYEHVVVTDRYDQPYILFLFYLKYPPEKFQVEHSLTTRDSYGFSTVRDFDKYTFISITDWDKLREVYRNSLIAGTDEEIYKGTNVVKRIYFPNGDIAFEVVAN